jgi:MFS family permease
VAARLRRQFELLGSTPGFRLLFLATLGSGVGTWLAFVALTVDVFDRTRSASWVSALLIADFLPAIVIGLLLGPLVDRLSRRRLMIASDLVRCAVFAALPFAGGAGTIVALAAVAGIATSVFRPAAYAGLPNLVSDQDLPKANSLLQTIENASWALGPPLGGILVAVSSSDGAYWLNAASFLVSAVLVARIPGAKLQTRVAESKGHWRDLVEGFSLLGRSRAILTVVVAWNVATLASAGVNVAEIFLAKITFDAGDFGFGLLVGSAGLGLALGSLVSGSWVDARGLATVYAIALAVMAVGIGLGAISPNVWTAAPAVLVSGIGNGAAVVCNAVLVQRGAPDQLRGRAFTVAMALNFAVLGLGMLLAGPLTDAVGARWVWGGAAGLTAVAAVLGLGFARGIVWARAGHRAQTEAAPQAL